MARIVAHVAPDILVLAGVDWDLDVAALGAIEARFAAAGQGFAHRFALRPNSGMATGLDMDGDGRRGGPRDAQGYGRFAGAGGLAVLSRYPIDTAGARDFSGLLWRDLPGAQLPRTAAGPFPSREALAVQRLSSTGHWDVPILMPDGPPLHLLTWYGTPPVFDGPEDRNGLRNADEALFWLAYLGGSLPEAPPAGRFLLAGAANLDPADGDGRGGAMARILAAPQLRDPAPASLGGARAADRDHSGDPARDTADWPDPPGNLRVDYLLPSADLTVTSSGVFWPAPEAPEAALLDDSGSHRLVWIDLALPPGPRAGGAHGGAAVSAQLDPRASGG